MWVGKLTHVSKDLGAFIFRVDHSKKNTGVHDREGEDTMIMPKRR